MQQNVVLTENQQELTTTADPVCTSVCTSNTENANAGNDSTPSDALTTLAAAIGSLSAADRAALVAMLTQAAPSNEAAANPPPFNRCENGSDSTDAP